MPPTGCSDFPDHSRTRNMPFAYLFCQNGEMSTSRLRDFAFALKPAANYVTIARVPICCSFMGSFSLSPETTLSRFHHATEFINSQEFITHSSSFVTDDAESGIA